MKTKEIILAGLFAALTSLLSVIRIPVPFSPVPITLQVLGITLAGAILGKKLGFLSQLTYVLLGAIGVPVFAGGSGGLGVIFGPTGGYIIGFIIAGYIIGLLVEIGINNNSSSVRGHLVIFFSMIAGMTIIYTFGTLQLMIVANLTLKKAVVQGILPFLLPGLIKTTVGTGIAYQIRKKLIAAQLLPEVSPAQN